jgi:hypothetical protein
MNCQDFVSRITLIHAGFITDKMGQTLYLQTNKALQDPNPGGYEVCWCGFLWS